MTSRLRTLLGCAALLLASAFTAGVASAQSITITGCQSLSAPVTSGNNISVTCNPNVSQPGAPVCSGASITGTSTLTFAATCTAGTNPITKITFTATPGGSADWCGPTPPASPCGSSPFSVSVPSIAVPTVSTTYAVTATDGTLSGSASAFYSVSGGGGGAVDLSACTSLGYTAAYYDIAYPITGVKHVDYIYQNSIPSGLIFGNGAALVVRFTTPALGQNDSTQPNFAAEIGANNNRQATLGTAPCLVPTANSPLPTDMNHNLQTNPVIKTQISQTPAFPIQIVPNGICNLGVACTWSSMVWLAPSTTYYITLVNKSSFTGTPNSCTSANCDMRLDFNN